VGMRRCGARTEEEFLALARAVGLRRISPLKASRPTRATCPTRRTGTRASGRRKWSSGSSGRCLLI
jgi:hypothetical protein